MRLIVHFGLHKTGSSSIQGSLAEHLDDPRTSYVLLRRANGSGTISQGFDSAFAKRPKNAHRGLDEARVEAMRSRARALLRTALGKAQARAPTAVLSAEAITSLSHPDLEDLAQVLREYASSIEAIAYVRLPKSYLESAMQQKLKRRLVVPTTYAVQYIELMHRFDTVFGRENVQFHKFERERLKNGCVVQDFCERIGIAFDPKKVLTRNESLSLPAIQLLYAYRTRHPHRRKGDADLIGRLSGLKGPRLAFHSELFSQMARIDPQELEAMAARTGADFTEDWTLHDETAIRSLKEIKTPGEAALAWLSAQSGVAPERLARDESALQQALVGLTGPGALTGGAEEEPEPPIPARRAARREPAAG